MHCFGKFAFTIVKRSKDFCLKFRALWETVLNQISQKYLCNNSTLLVKRICILCIIISFVFVSFWLSYISISFCLCWYFRTNTDTRARIYSISDTMKGIVNHFMTLKIFFILVIKNDQEGGHMSVNVQSLQERKSTVSSACLARLLG